MILVGVDPGFATFGLCAVEMSRPGKIDRILRLGAVLTSKDDEEKWAFDLLRRLREIVFTFRELLSLHHPAGICMEALSLPRNAGAAAKVAVAYGAVAGVGLYTASKLFVKRPQDIRTILGAHAGISFPTKESVHEWLIAEHELPAMRAKERPHAYDAVAAVLAISLDPDCWSELGR